MLYVYKYGRMSMDILRIQPSTEDDATPYTPIPHSHTSQTLAVGLVNTVDQFEADPNTKEPSSDSTTLVELFYYPSASATTSLCILTDLWKYGEQGLKREATYHDFTHVDISVTPLE